MTDLKARPTQTMETTPNVKAGDVFRKIISVEFRDTQYRNAKNETQKVAILTVDAGGNGSITKVHTTSGAIVQTLHDFFVKDGIKEPLENVKVVEIKSPKSGRMYLSLAPSN